MGGRLGIIQLQNQTVPGRKAAQVPQNLRIEGQIRRNRLTVAAQPEAARRGLTQLQV